jgi:hypothetical protein
LDNLFNLAMRFGTFAAIDPATGTEHTFEPGGTPGDWFKGLKVPFASPLPAPPGGGKLNTSVVVTPHSRGLNSLAVVPVVTFIDNTHFEVDLRNSDNRKGRCDFHWIAVADVAEGRQLLPDVRFGLLQPKRFRLPQPGDGPQDQGTSWNRWMSVKYSTPFAGPPTVVATANNHGVRPEDVALDVEIPTPLGGIGIFDVKTPAGLAPASYGEVAAVGCTGPELVGPLTALPQAFRLHARNADARQGSCGFSFAAVARSAVAAGAAGALVVDHGDETRGEDRNTEVAFSAGGTAGDWQAWDVYFDRPFSEAPVVLGTAKGSVPAVVVVRNVTRFGFSAALRNTDSRNTFGGFHWIAFGCGFGCG